MPGSIAQAAIRAGARQAVGFSERPAAEGGTFVAAANGYWEYLGSQNAVHYIASQVKDVATGQPLKSLITAFVYRRYLDYGVFEGLRQLHLKVRDEAQRRAAGRPERANDVKLSRGGIREIEFIVQLLLVVRGG